MRLSSRPRRNPAPDLHTSSKDRRGALYVAVLAVTLVVSMLVLSGLHAATLYLKATQSGDDREQARLLATSAIEHALAEFNTNTSWRDDFATDTEYPSPAVSVMGGTFAWKLVDTGGAGSGKTRLDGIGRVGDATCVLSVDLKQTLILDAALLIGGHVTVNAGQELTVTGGPMVSNGTLTNDGIITGSVEAQSINGGGTVSGSQTTSGDPRQMPDSATLFDYYLENGTVITPPYRSSEGACVIDNCLLSPGWNPYGLTDSDGIYVVETFGESLVIKESRIVGTLVVPDLPSGRNVRVKGKVNWEPAYPNFPALLVDGDLKFEHEDGGLKERFFFGPNLNPGGTPWQGASDLYWNDTYPSDIAGIIYCSGDLEFDGNHANHTTPLEGLIIAAGNCTLSEAAKPIITYDASFAALPPPGFGDGKLHPPGQVAACTNLSATSTDTVRFDKSWGEYFRPELPSNAIMWRVTNLELWVRKPSSGNGTLHVITHTAQTSRKPKDVIADVSVPSSSLPGSFGWFTVPIARPGRWLPATESMCITLEATGSDEPAEVEYGAGDVSGNSTALLSGNGTTWNSPEPQKSLGFKVDAEYTTTAGDTVSISVGSWRQTPGP